MGIVVPVALTIGPDTQRGGGNLKPRATERQLIVTQDSWTGPGERKLRQTSSQVGPVILQIRGGEELPAESVWGGEPGKA